MIIDVHRDDRGGRLAIRWRVQAGVADVDLLGGFAGRTGEVGAGALVNNEAAVCAYPAQRPDRLVDVAALVNGYQEGARARRASWVRVADIDPPCPSRARYQIGA